MSDRVDAKASAFSILVDKELKGQYENLIRSMNPLHKIHPAARKYYSWGFGGVYPMPFAWQVKAQLYMDPLPHERLKTWLRRQWRDYRPVIMTHKKLEEERSYYE